MSNDDKHTTIKVRSSAGASFVDADAPPAHVQSAVRRLGTAAALYAVAFLITNAPAFFTAPEAWAKTFGWPERLAHFNVYTAFVCSAVGLGFFGLTRAGQLPARTIVRLGHVFGVFAAFGIALPTHLAEGTPLGAGTWVCAWILLFPMLVPTQPMAMLPTMLLASLSSPVAVALGAAFDLRPTPAATDFVFVLVPNLICTGVGLGVSRVVRELRSEAIQAGELGSYTLLERLGRGGMGEVWRAEHRMLARPSAIKLIRTDAIASDPESELLIQRRFEREARATAALLSPHTVNLYDFGVAEDGTFYYVMELLDGMDLDDAVSRFGPMPPARAVKILMQVCSSLADAHDAGLVHRDIKPANIFLCRMGVEVDYVKVLDFGLVATLWSAAGNETRLTEDGVISGTPAFLPPEIALPNGEVGPRSDIYSLGCVAYWLLTGELVFDREKAMQTILDHIKTPPTPMSARTEIDIPPDLEALVMQCLAKDPNDRPQSADEMLERLEACEVPGGWMRRDAQRWWALHRPTAPASRRDSIVSRPDRA